MFINVLCGAMQPVAQVAALSGKLHSVKLAHKSLKGVLEAPQERSLDTAMISPAEVRGAIQFEGVSLGFAEGAPKGRTLLHCAIYPNAGF